MTRTREKRRSDAFRGGGDGYKRVLMDALAIKAPALKGLVRTSASLYKTTCEHGKRKYSVKIAAPVIASIKDESGNARSAVLATANMEDVNGNAKIVVLVIVDMAEKNGDVRNVELATANMEDKSQSAKSVEPAIVIMED